jgi:trans-2-enoyl-CoA reductase
MKELTCEIEKENGSAVSKLWINFYTYEIDRGLIFQYKLLNDFDHPVDAGETILGGADWQNWPSSELNEQGEKNDENYILNKICDNLLLKRKV